MNLDRLVQHLLDACVELRKEVSALPEGARLEGERWRFAMLEELRHKTPDPREVAIAMIARAYSQHGEELANWLEAMFDRFEDVPPESRRRLVERCAEKELDAKEGRRSGNW